MILFSNESNCLQAQAVNSLDWPTAIILGTLMIRRDSEATVKAAALQTVDFGRRLIKPVPLSLMALPSKCVRPCVI